MSHLGPVRFEVIGDRAEAARYFGVARKFIADLQQRSGGVLQNRARHNLKDGTVIVVQIAGSIISAVIDVTGGGAEEALRLYLIASDGLRIYNLQSKALVMKLTGLEEYVFQEVTKHGAFVYLSGQNVARVDVHAKTAFGYQYSVKTTEDALLYYFPIVYATSYVDGLASNIAAVVLSPDETKLLLYFKKSGVAVPASPGFIEVREGVGGVMLVDAKTLAPLRGPIRMTYEPAPMAWRADSKCFYVGTAFNVDNGDIDTAWLDQAPPTSRADYVSVFDAAGVLRGSRQVWTAPEQRNQDAGYSRAIRGLVANATRVYVTVIGDLAFEGGFRSTLYVLDATDDELPILASMVLPSSIGAYYDGTPVAPSDLCLSRDGKTLTMACGGNITSAAGEPKVAEFSVANDNLELLYVSAHEEFRTHVGGRAGGKNGVIQLAPTLSPGARVNSFRFFHNIATDINVVRAYTTFEQSGTPEVPHDVYEFDLRAEEPSITFKDNYGLAIAPSRKVPNKRASA